MEGVVDWVMRDTLTSIGGADGGIDQCVTEFLRVTDKLHPFSVFYKNCPELRTQSRTRSGVPVFVQLLGGQAGPLAANAVRAAELGALGVDLNFGCPAKTVNRHDGGAALLKSAHRLHDIISEVRKAVPAHVPVTAKMRLGFDDPSHCIELAQAVEAAGPNWLTIHCRTKTDGYKPPAHWEWIPKIREVVKIRIVTNGEIGSVDDFHRCHEVAQTQDYMIGRGALSNPYLFSEIKKTLNSSERKNPTPWEQITPLIPGFYQASSEYINDHFAVSRTKQWLKALSLKHTEAKDLFEKTKRLTQPLEYKTVLIQNLPR